MVASKDAIKITLVEDNLNTHNPASLYKAFDPEEALRIIDKLEFCYTPNHGSWLDMAEIELSILSRQCLNRRIPDKETLFREVKVWEKIVTRASQLLSGASLQKMHV